MVGRTISFEPLDLRGENGGLPFDLVQAPAEMPILNVQPISFLRDVSQLVIHRRHLDSEVGLERRELLLCALEFVRKVLDDARLHHDGALSSGDDDRLALGLQLHERDERADDAGGAEKRGDQYGCVHFACPALTIP